MLQQPPLFINAKPKLVFIILFIAVILFSILSSFLASSHPGIFNSPDETANYYFAKQFKEENNFFLPSPSGRKLPDFVMPRSMVRQGEHFVPIGFIGFPLLLGLLAKIFSFKILPFFIIVLSGLAALAWFGFLKTIFGSRIALLSSFLLLLHPAYLAYTSRPFSPNILFVNFLIFAAYFAGRVLSARKIKLPEGETINTEIPFTSQSRSKRYFFSFLFGLALGIALMIRPIEIFWLGLTLLLVFIFLRRNLKGFSFITSSFGFVLPCLPVLLFQKLTYGGFLQTGYHLTLSPAVQTSVWSFLFPFGFDLGRSWMLAAGYLIFLFWWLVLFILIGLAAIFLRTNSTPPGFRFKITVWLIIFGIVTLWLCLFYGPWQITDRLDQKVGLGVSFVRYFLPVYILGIPIVALGIWRVIHFLGKKGRFISSLAVMVLIFLSLRIVWWSGDESALAIFRTLKNNREIREKALSIVPNNMIILTERGDKIFFPYREVMSYSRRPAELEAISQLADDYEIVYETFLEQKDAVEDNRIFWAPFGLQIREGESIGSGHRIYKIKSIKPEGTKN